MGNDNYSWSYSLRYSAFDAIGASLFADTLASVAAA
jgi:hypothetical protein